uniref:C3H1-type domain-containing protein n=1 Tax=Timema shepardi TaxID=629360 RepID=A0A7R9FZL3_TIMSH|nr:unnamed protein product [Timema shepardi]
MDSDSSLDGEFETKQEIAVQSRRDSTTHQYDSSGEEGEGEDEIESNQDVISNRDNTSDHEDNLSSHIGPSSLHGDLSNVDETSNQENASGVTISDVSFQDKVIHHKETSNHSLDRDDLSRRGGLVKSPAREDRALSVSVESNDDGELSDSSHDSEGNSHISSVLSVKSVTGRKVDDDEDDDGELLEEGEHAEEMSTSHRDGAVNAARQNAIAGHGTDLSDVSDLDSNDGRDSIGCVSDEGKRKKSGSSKPPLAPAVEVEQLDFEAEEQQDKEEREEGECDRKSEDEGEIKGEDLEEGEVTDDEENRPEETEPRPICRFYNRGQCTWGSSCRFLHPGVTDKGNYTMFDMVRPLVPLMRKSTKRKETDMDFEEKKMNLSLGQEELDKENDYYTRPASPVKSRQPLIKAEVMSGPTLGCGRNLPLVGSRVVGQLANNLTLLAHHTPHPARVAVQASLVTALTVVTHVLDHVPNPFLALAKMHSHSMSSRSSSASETSGSSSDSSESSYSSSSSSREPSPKGGSTVKAHCEESHIKARGIVETVEGCRRCNCPQEI